MLYKQQTLFFIFPFLTSFRMKRFLLFVSFVFLASCSTFLTGAKQQIAIRSNINGADVFLNGERKCDTPCTLVLPKQKDAYVFMLKAEGWKDVTVELHSALNAMLTSNSSNLFVGSLTDLTTGAFWAYNQDTLYVVLSPVKGTVRAERVNALALQKYAFANYSHIQAESLIKHDKGEYSLTLSQKTGLSVDQIWAILKQAKTPADFSEEITNRFRSR